MPKSNWWLLPTNLAVALVLLIPVARASSQFNHDPNAFGYPVAATTYLIQHYPNARVFNDYNYGGYLIYRFSQSGTPLKVYVDGREEMYGDDFLRHYFHVAWGYRRVGKPRSNEKASPPRSCARRWRSRL